MSKSVQIKFDITAELTNEVVAAIAAKEPRSTARSMSRSRWLEQCICCNELHKKTNATKRPTKHTIEIGYFAKAPIAKAFSFISVLAAMIMLSASNVNLQPYSIEQKYMTSSNLLIRSDSSVGEPLKSDVRASPEAARKSPAPPTIGILPVDVCPRRLIDPSILEAVVPLNNKLEISNGATPGTQLAILLPRCCGQHNWKANHCCALLGSPVPLVLQ
ncbi:hypothetical protein SELMODRAFT_405138 [Selaginella moellendorffii]|uniref:Uncharacterized protein n=1 Tax=Selaginella moellendorffii TaxID=88036 RepID=D8QYI9_SELML|nr:hypothetical protein SELMODRAFT_405138 [Selaginella moellendorffii]